MNKHLIVVSVDAMVYEDLALLAKLPGVGGLLQKGSVVKNIKTIYPSLTHPVHATLMTGCPAEKTGVVCNEVFQPGCLTPPWYNRMEQVKCDTLFHAAHRAGLTTAACRWPLTAGGFDAIDYLVPEVMDADAEAEPDLAKLYRAVSSPCLYDEVVAPRLALLNGQKHPNDENFSISCACEIIRRYRPNLLMTHPCMVDSTRHQNGLFGSAVDEALRLTDAWICQLIEAVREAGIEEETSFAIVSDHGHMEIKRAIAFNVFLRDHGLIETNEQGELTAWRAYAKSCELSMEVYVKDKCDEPEVYGLLKRLCDEGIYGVSEVLTADEAQRRYGLAGDFSFVLETDGYSSFVDNWTRPVVAALPENDYHHGVSTHGHMPEKGPQPPMIVCGPAFQSGVTLEKGSILDEAPTFAAALGLELPQAQGKAMQELLR